MAGKMANNLTKNLYFQIQKRFLQSSATRSSNSTFSATRTSSSSSFTVQYLVNSCGFPLESALSVSQKFKLNQKYVQRAQSVVDLLKSHNFSDAQVAKLIVKEPTILHCNVEAVLRPKLDYLVKNGFVGELLPQLIFSNTGILRSSLDSKIRPSIEFLRSLIESDEKMLSAIKRSSILVTCNLKVIMQPNIQFLIKERVPAHILGNAMISQPRTLMHKHERMVYAVNYVKNLGFEPTSPMFMHALRIFLQMSDSTWKKKIEVMKSMGCDEEEILMAFKRVPFLLACSEEKIKKAMDFYTNTMNLDPHFVISVPILLKFSIEKRIIPRYNILKDLESKKLIQGVTIKTARPLIMSEENFFKNYVLKYMVEIPGLLKLYPGADKLLDKLIDRAKGDVHALPETYPGLKNFLNKYFEKLRN